MSHIDDRPPLPAHIDTLNAAKRAVAIAKADLDAARTLLGILEQGGMKHSDPLWIGTRLRLLMGETVLREAMSLHNNSEGLSAVAL